MKKLVLFFIRSYQQFPLFRFRSILLSFSSRTCRFRPTCSQYTYQAISGYGIIRGSWLSLKRILRCHPWNQGGWDPVKRKEDSL